MCNNANNENYISSLNNPNNFSINNNNFNSNNNNISSQTLKSTLLNSMPFIIDENNTFLVNTFPEIFSRNNMHSNNEGFANLTDNNLNSFCESQTISKSNPFAVVYEKTINILCLDDDQIFLGMLSNHLKYLAREFPKIKFDFILTTGFQDFFNKFISLATRNIVIDIFIMDQNISHSLKGVDCCRLVNEFYLTCFRESYTDMKFWFLFVTEEKNLYKFTINKNEVNLIRKDQIFSKMQFKKLYAKLIEIIELI